MKTFPFGPHLLHWTRVFVAALWFSGILARAQPFYITEFMAENNTVLLNGVYEDWIEIYNSADSPMNLSGWHLTDSPDDLEKWAFPPIAMPSKSFLIVFASGKDQTNSVDDLHTNFRLNLSGEYLALVNPDGRVMQEFNPYPGQRTNVAYGLFMSGITLLGGLDFLAPTPRRPNPAYSIDSSPGIVGFSFPGGRFSTPFYLTLSSPRIGSQIHYELETDFQRSASERKVPTLASPIYTQRIWIDRAVRVLARAWPMVSGPAPGPLHSETYLPIDTNLISFSSSLPMLVVDTVGSMGDETFPEYGPAGVVSIELYSQNGFASLAYPAIRLRGSFGTLERSGGTESFGLQLLDELEEARSMSVLGLPANSEWVLRSPSTPSLITEPMAFQMSRDAGRYAPRTRFVELFLNINGQALSTNQYRGIYLLEEKVKSGPARFDLDPLLPSQSTAPEVTGGYLLSTLNRMLEPRLLAGGASLNYEEPNYLELTNDVRESQRAYLQSFFDGLGAALTGANFATRFGTNHYSFYLDVDAAIDCHLPEFITLNAAGLEHGCYLRKPRGGSLTMGPVSSYSESAWGTLGNPRLNISTALFSSAPWWNSLLAEPDFFQRWLDRYQALREGPWQTNLLAAWIDRFADEVRAAQPRGSIPLGRGPRVGSLGNATYSHAFDGSYQGEVEFLKRWLFDRLSSIDSLFLGTPIVLAQGEQVTLIDHSGLPNTQFYYTLDGSDPRASQGGVSRAAFLYSGQFTVSHHAIVTARAFNNFSYPGIPIGAVNPTARTYWSGKSQTRVVVRAPLLRVTELMYHPAPSLALSGSPYDRDQFQFIEFKNFEPIPIELGGMQLAQGVEFTFPPRILPPNQYVVVVRNKAAFESRYGSNLPVAGEFTGNLSPSGEVLQLRDVFGSSLLEFSYDDAWYPLTDGPGLALVPASESDPENLSTRRVWKAGKLLHGSPGRAEPSVIPVVPVVINELLSNPEAPNEDFVELYNPTPQPADISFWYLSDNAGQPRKFRFPPGSLIPPFDFLAIDEHAFNPYSDPPLPTSFSFNAQGDEIYLFSANAAGDLTGYIHGFRFGAAATNVAFTRVLLGDADELVMPESQFTVGASNAAPAALAGSALAALEVTEIMARASPLILGGSNVTTESEFLELHNSGNAALDLTGLKLSDAIRFTFPHWLLAPDGYVLVVANTDVFAARYGTNLPVAGAYSSSLSAAGERLLATDTRGELVLDTRFPSVPPTVNGFSLVPSTNSINGWRSSASLNGSPGMADPESAILPVFINELFSGSSTNTTDDRVELFNPNPIPVSVANWSIGVRIPEGVIVPPGGYRTVSARFPASGFSTLQSFDPLFGVTGFADQVNFYPVDEGLSVGRYLTTDGRTLIVPLATPTPEASNSAPLLGPVFISEIRATPPPEQLGTYSVDSPDAYVELQNLSSVAVPLHVPAVPERTWQLRGTVGYNFPPGTSIGPHGTLLLVSFNPAVESLAERFRGRNRVPPSIPLFGPWVSTLSASPMMVELVRYALRNDGVAITFQYQSVQPVDGVDYFFAPPWPLLVAPWSLTRVHPLTFGNDPASWRLSLPSPGFGNETDAPVVILVGPQSQSVPLESSVAFSVTASGSLPLQYQWQFNGQPLPQGTNRVLTLERVRPDQAGTYSVLVADRGGAAVTAHASLTLRPNVAISRQPANVVVRVLPDPLAAPKTNANFELVAFTANPPLSWRWLKDGHELSGATNASLTVRDVSLADEGDYVCALTDAASTSLSQPARLSPVIGPRFLISPSDQRVLTGSLVNVSAVVSGYPLPFTFEWRSINPPRFTNIYMAPSNTGFWNFAAPAVAGTTNVYRAIVRLSPNPNLLAAFANFNVITAVDSNNDGLPDDYELAHHFDPAAGQNGPLDTDGDGRTNLEEYRAGTDPLDPLSYLKLDAPSLPEGANAIQLEFFARSNRTYTLEFLENDFPAWSTLADIAAHPTNRVVTLNDAVASGMPGHRRYRLRTPHQGAF